MDMATDPADYIASASNGDDLVAWSEPNTAALADERTEAAVLRALGGPTPEDLAYGVPLLRFADHSIPAIPLVQAVIMDVRHSPTTCDRCDVNERWRTFTRLLVPCGASVVALHICEVCKSHLDQPWVGAAPSSLVWG